ncbi:hypothetical protein V6669_09485 [Paenibacillus sp. Y5S-9]|uniref:hypothetical protein n=1 Tax=Paenibacillus sp. Y5S-9 TaxID=3122489 RepID=UPI0030D3E90B
MKIPNYHIPWLGKYILNLKMNTQGERMKNRFLNEILSPLNDKWNKEIESLTMLHAERDEYGNFIILESNEVGDRLSMKDKRAFIKDYNDLALENAYISTEGENEDVVIHIAKMFLEMECLAQTPEAYEIYEIYRNKFTKFINTKKGVV